MSAASRRAGMADGRPVEERIAVAAAVAAAMTTAGLSPRQREAAWQYVAGVPRADIAARMGISDNTLRAHLDLAAAKLDPDGEPAPRSRTLLLRRLVERGRP